MVCAPSRTGTAMTTTGRLLAERWVMRPVESVPLRATMRAISISPRMVWSSGTVTASAPWPLAFSARRATRSAWGGIDSAIHWLWEA
jgi:hypothetical protein